MKNTKFFIISGLLVLFFGMGIFVFNVINTRETKNVDVTTTQRDTITVYETEQPEYIMDGNSCFRTSFTKTTETKDGVLVGEYQENIFMCFCKGEKKAIEGFEFKTTDSVAGPVCDEQCAKLCQNRK